MSAYYNEIDPAAAAWLRELIKHNQIAPGDVDERSIEDVCPTDLMGYTQCHFFAGIGVWSYALRLAGWPDDMPVWTGSCPCQPFSAAGKGKGFADERHLWPAFFHLIEVCGPERVFGEQVAGKDGLGWLDLVATDLEAVGYTCGAVPFPAAGIGAPHIRERLYWVADAIGGRQSWTCRRGAEQEQRFAERGLLEIAGRGEAGGMGDTERRVSGRVLGEAPCAESSIWRLEGPDYHGPVDASAGMGAGLSGPTNGHWGSADWLGCRDGSWRTVEPGTFPLAHGAAQRVGRLRGYGNGLVAQQAQAFIESYIEVRAA